MNHKVYIIFLLVIHNSLVLSTDAIHYTLCTQEPGLTNHGLLVGDEPSVASCVNAGTNGQVLVGATSANPAFISPTAGSGLTITTNATTLQYNIAAPVTVPYGGTGKTTLTAYAVLAGGTTSTNSLQPLASVGSSGNVLVSSGANALPTWASLPQSAFGELLTIQPSPVVQLQFPYNINSRYIIGSTTASGTITQTNSMLSLQTGATTTSSATLKSRSRLQYQPGQGAACLFTALYTTGATGSTQVTGIGNDIDGFFFGYNGTSFGILHRNSSTDTWIPQNSWNQDVCNGTGPSGIVLDTTKGNVYKIQFQWLGFGRINFYIENQANGNFVLVHQIQYANANTIPSISNPSLQIMSQVQNTTNATNITMQNGSLAAFIEGVASPIDERNNISASKSISTTNKNILTIKNNTSFQSKTNQVTIYPDMISLFNSPEGSGDALFVAYLNPTVGGTPSFTHIDVNSSVVSYDSAGTTISGGTQLFSFFLANGTDYSFNMYDYNVQLTPGDTLVFACQSTSGSITVHASISWIERF